MVEMAWKSIFSQKIHKRHQVCAKCPLRVSDQSSSRGDQSEQNYWCWLLGWRWVSRLWSLIICVQSELCCSGTQFQILPLEDSGVWLQNQNICLFSTFQLYFRHAMQKWPFHAILNINKMKYFYTNNDQSAIFVPEHRHPVALVIMYTDIIMSMYRSP